MAECSAAASVVSKVAMWEDLTAALMVAYSADYWVFELVVVKVARMDAWLVALMALMWVVTMVVSKDAL